MDDKESVFDSNAIKSDQKVLINQQKVILIWSPYGLRQHEHQHGCLTPRLCPYCDQLLPSMAV